MATRIYHEALIFTLKADLGTWNDNFCYVQASQLVSSEKGSQEITIILVKLHQFLPLKSVPQPVSQPSESPVKAHVARTVFQFPNLLIISTSGREAFGCKKFKE